MIDRAIVKELQKQGYSYAEIALYFSVSRQRIHQIIKNYKNTGRNNRKKKYRDFGKCSECPDVSTVLHHIDFNNENDDVKNLQPLCKLCHLKKHHKNIYKPIFTDVDSLKKYESIQDAKELILKDWKEGKLSHKEIFRKYNFSRKKVIDLITEEGIDPFYKKN